MSATKYTQDRETTVSAIVNVNREQHAQLHTVMGCHRGDIGRFKGGDGEIRRLDLTIDKRMCPNGLDALEEFLRDQKVMYTIVTETTVEYYPVFEKENAR